MATTSRDDDVRRLRLVRRIRILVAVTISYNVVEAMVSTAAGVSAGSTALVGFGLDSVIEVSSAAAVAWQFSARDRIRRDARERTALRVIASSFFLLAAYVAVESSRALAGVGEADSSAVGVALAAVSLAVMPGLSLAQRHAGRALGSATAVADSRQTLLCTYLSAVLLVGLLLNTLVGWSWADPLVGLVIAAVAVKEGCSTWRSGTCCATPSLGWQEIAEPPDCCVPDERTILAIEDGSPCRKSPMTLAERELVVDP